MNEKEARERVEKYIKSFNGNALDCVAIGTLLNLLEKKDKEISKLKNNNKELLRKLRNRVKEVKKLTKYSLYKKEFSTLNKQVKKKDKIIDEMAYNIATTDSNLCQYIDETKRCKKYAGENKLTCDECIKQYFERKVENGN